MVGKVLRDKIIAQTIKEIDFARQYKQARVKSWKKNEDMYYGRKTHTDDSRANVELGKMQGFVHTILSKIDNPLMFKYTKRKESDLKKSKLMNALRERDANQDDWDMKDLLGKKQGIIYGRAIYCYYADSGKGYKAHLEPVDVYDFLIDPAGGGYDLEQAFYMGRYGIIKTKQDLKDGRKDGIYIADAVRLLTSDGDGNANEINQEETNKANRYFNFARTSLRQIQNPDKYKFWEWYTTYEGTRYYLLITNDGVCVRCEVLEDLFAADMFPFWSWAAFPDLTEFWTPSYSDYVREIFMAQSISINQMIDNAEAINKPMKAVVTKHIENMAELKFRKDGYIRIKDTDDINKVFQTVQVNSISTPITVYNTLDQIAQLESGVTAAVKGNSEGTDIATIYEGNIQQAADRFGFLNKSYSYGYKRFAVLYENGVYEHLNKKTAVEVTGPEGIEMVNISKRDIKPRGGFNYIIQASDAETNADNADKRNKLTWLSNTMQNPTLAPMLNPKKVIEMQAGIAGFDLDEVRELLDTDAWGDADLMSEAAEDIEKLIDNDPIKPNAGANIAYKQKIVDFMMGHYREMDQPTFQRFTDYLSSLEVFVVRNTVRVLNDKMAQATMAGPQEPQGSPTAAPTGPVADPTTPAPAGPAPNTASPPASNTYQ